MGLVLKETPEGAVKTWVEGKLRDFFCQQLLFQQLHEAFHILQNTDKTVIIMLQKRQNIKTKQILIFLNPFLTALIHMKQTEGPHCCKTQNQPTPQPRCDNLDFLFCVVGKYNRQERMVVFYFVFFKKAKSD